MKHYNIQNYVRYKKDVEETIKRIETKEQKLSIVGELIGRSKRIHEDDIYQCMLDINDLGKKITITQLALYLECSARTIHRNMSEQLKREKELLNQQL